MLLWNEEARNAVKSIGIVNKTGKYSHLAFSSSYLDNTSNQSAAVALRHPRPKHVPVVFDCLRHHWDSFGFLAHRDVELRNSVLCWSSATRLASSPPSAGHLPHLSPTPSAPSLVLPAGEQTQGRIVPQPHLGAAEHLRPSSPCK